METNLTTIKGIDVKRLLVMLTLMTIGFSETLLAESRYVIDELSITVRSGRSNQHNILKLLRSGAKVEVIDEIEENNRVYALIRAGDIEGWVQAQYLSNQPIARDKLASLEKKLETSRETIASLKQKLALIQQQHTEVSKQRDAYDNNADKLSKQLEQLQRAAAKPIETARQNDKLRMELATLRKEHALIQQDYERVKDSNERDWFVTGAGVVFFSTIFGILLTRIRLRRKKAWGSTI
jgi:SH3 domain protein